MCTDFIISSTENVYVNGRTVDFAQELDSMLFFRKAGHQFLNQNRPARAQFIWNGKYSYMGVNAYGVDMVSDGLNTEGLSGGALWLPESQYPEETIPAKTITNVDFLQWILSSFATCNEVIIAMGKSIPEEKPLNTFFEYEDALAYGPQVQVTAVTFREIGGVTAPDGFYPIHFPLHDRTGHSIVIEFIDGKAHIYNNPVHVCTNAPEFPYHISNLRNFVNLSNKNVFSCVVNGYELTAAGNGGGLLGLPGDPTPPGRFIRTAFMSSLVDQPENASEALNLGFHILNAVDVPKGFVKDPGNATEQDYTQVAISKDLTHLIYAVRYYESPQVFAVNLNEVNWDERDGQSYAPKFAGMIPLF